MARQSKQIPKEAGPQGLCTHALRPSLSHTPLAS